MSITTEINRTDELTTDGIETEFDFSMLIHADSEVQVWYEVTDGDYTQLVLDTDYTVIFTDLGGAVTTIGASSPYAAGKILIIRNIALTQQTNWLFNDNHSEQQHQDDFDRSSMRDIQIQETLDRSVKFAIHSGTTDIEFPEPEASGIIGWDSGGTVLENKTLLGGLADLTDPGADRILFWDDDADKVDFLTASTGLSLTGTNLTTDDSAIDHDALLNFTANEHYLQSAITEVGTIATGVWEGTDVGVAHGGTGASNAGGARTNLGLVIGTDVLAFDTGLQNLAGVAMAANKFYYTSGDNVHVAADVTAFARSILDDANEATFKATVNLEIGTDVLAEQTIGIADNNLLEVDGTANSGEYARFTANGLEGRTLAEMAGEIDHGNLTGLDTGADHSYIDQDVTNGANVTFGTLNAGAIIIPDNGFIGSVTNTEAIQIASSGNVTFSDEVFINGGFLNITSSIPDVAIGMVDSNGNGFIIYSGDDNLFTFTGDVLLQHLTVEDNITIGDGSGSVVSLLLSGSHGLFEFEWEERAEEGDNDFLALRSENTAKWDIHLATTDDSMNIIVDGTGGGTLTLQDFDVVIEEDLGVTGDIALGSGNISGSDLDITAGTGDYSSSGNITLGGTGTVTAGDKFVIGTTEITAGVFENADNGFSFNNEDLSTTGDLNIGIGGTLLDVDSTLGTIGIGTAAISTNLITMAAVLEPANDFTLLWGNLVINPAAADKDYKALDYEVRLDSVEDIASAVTIETLLQLGPTGALTATELIGNRNTVTITGTKGGSWDIADVCMYKAVSNLGGLNTQIVDHCVFEAGAINLTGDNADITGSAYMFRALAPNVSGTDGLIANLYGLHLADMTHAKVTNAWSIYAEGTSPSSHAGNFRIGSNVAPDTALHVTGAIASSTVEITNGTYNNIDVAGVNTLFINTSGGNVIIQGTINGIDGQVLYVVVEDATGNTTIETENGVNQDFFLHAEADETMTAEHGGWVFINDSGDHWHDCSHAKHV